MHSPLEKIYSTYVLLERYCKALIQFYELSVTNFTALQDLADYKIKIRRIKKKHQWLLLLRKEIKKEYKIRQTSSRSSRKKEAILGRKRIGHATFFYQLLMTDKTISWWFTYDCTFSIKYLLIECKIYKKKSRKDILESI